MSLNPNTRSLIAYLVQLAKKDGQVAPTELMFIQSVALKLQVAPTDLTDIIRSSDFATLEVPATVQQKVSKLYSFLGLIKADLNIASEEKQFCVDIAQRLGLPKTHVDAALANIENIDSEETLAAYFN
jgi:uncharacterized tellurite resistance protein B-like protein